MKIRDFLKDKNDKMTERYRLVKLRIQAYFWPIYNKDLLMHWLNLE